MLCTGGEQARQVALQLTLCRHSPAQLCFDDGVQGRACCQFQVREAAVIGEDLAGDDQLQLGIHVQHGQ